MLWMKSCRELSDGLRKVLALADMASRDGRSREIDDLSFMAVQFLHKQMQHAESIFALIPRRDAAIFARTMIDGFCGRLRCRTSGPGCGALMPRFTTGS